jgi:hypothetical protein
LGRILVWRGLVAIRAWHIEDDSGFLAIFFLGDGGEGAEKLIGDVGEDGGAAGGDFVLREKKEQAREEVIDLGSGGEVVEVSGEGGGDFGGVGLRRRSGLGVLGAERLAAEADEAAAHAVGEAIVAARRVMDGAGFSELRSHWWFPLEVKWGFDTPWFCIDEKTKELLEEGFVKL